MHDDDHATEHDILLVEDSPAHAELVARCLRQNSARVNVTHAPDGHSALEHLDGLPSGKGPSLVLLDLQLPRMDGLDVLRAIRSSTQHASLPVLMLTSSDAVADVQAAYAAGANSYLIKPVGFQDLERLLDAVTDYWLGCNQPAPAFAPRSELG